MVRIYKENKILIWALAISFLMRVIFSFGNLKFLFLDVSTYDAYAMNILEKGVMYNSAYQAPGYTFFLAAVYFIFGHNLLAAYMAQSVLGTVCTLFIYLIGKEVFSKRVGEIAAAVSLLCLPLTFYSGILLAETVFLFFLLAGVYYFIKGIATNRWAYFLACGIAFALSTSTRSITLFFLPLIPLVYIIYNYKNIKVVIRNICIYGVVFCLILTPWVVRNFMIYHAFVPVDTLGGVNLYIGNNERADGFFVSMENDPNYHAGGNDYEIDTRLKKVAVNYIMQHPLRFVALTGKRLVLFLLMGCFNSDWVIVTYMQDHALFKSTVWMWMNLMVVGSFIMFGLSLFGLKDAVKNRKGLILLGAILYFTGLTSLFYIQSRYTLPITPFVAILAGLGIDRLHKRHLEKLQATAQ